MAISDLKRYMNDHYASKKDNKDFMHQGKEKFKELERTKLEQDRKFKDLQDNL